MGKVYFSKHIEKILEKLDYSRLGKKVAIKLHFGDKGCVTYLNPEIVRKIFGKVKSLGKEVKLVETNVLYRGSRTTRKDHLKTAREHGFDMPIDILDGEKGEEFIEVDGKKLGKGIKEYDSMIVVSHFKGHPMAGFGGSIKNLGMGLASRAGKLQMHSIVNPIVKNGCTACKTCIENCNANAIKIINGKAEIDSEKCEGCAMCIAVCPEGVIDVPWENATAEELQKGIVEYVDGVFKIIPKGKMIFINVLEKITKDCDCFSIKQEPIIEDIGILAGEDLIIDKASLELVNEKSNGKFEKLNPSGKYQLEYAKEKGLMEDKYEIVDLDK